MIHEGQYVCEIRQHEGVPVVVLGGAVDMRHTPDLHERLGKICERRPARLVINLEHVSYMDSSGLGTLVVVLRRVHGYGGRVALCGLSERVRSLFEITKLDKLFSIHPTEAEALAG